MPACGIMHKSHEELISFEEIAKIVEAAAKLGIDKIRLTGGEPLVRKDLSSLISLLNKTEGIRDIALTTNGILLKEYARELKKAGLRRLNISLDSLKEERYASITRLGKLEDVLAGIKKSIEVGFYPIKINVLLLENTTPDEIKNFLRLTIENSISVRFLEFMPVNSFYKIENPVGASLIFDIAKRFSDIEEAQVDGAGPAKTYRFRHALGTFGLISPLTNKFCGTCNRLRLTSDGFLKVCLHSDIKVNLREPLRQKADQKELMKLIRGAVNMKPEGHSLDKEKILTEEFSMCQIGG